MAMVVFAQVKEAAVLGAAVRVDAHALTPPQWLELAAIAAQSGARIEVEEKKQRIRLEGELPSPVDPPEGCRFINRCRFASERCRKERPELLEMEPGHLVACHCCEEMKKGQI